MKKIVLILLVIWAVLFQGKAYSQCNSEVTAEIVMSYAQSGTVFYAVVVTNHSERPIYLFAPLDYVEWFETQNCNFLHSTELDKLTIFSFDDRCPNAIIVNAGESWLNIYSLSFKIMSSMNDKPDCNDGTICVSLSYLTEPIDLDQPMNDLLRKVYHNQCVARSAPYPFSMEVPNQAVQRTRGPRPHQLGLRMHSALGPRVR